MPLGFSNQTQAVLPLGIRHKLKSSYLDEIRGQYGLATSSVIAERAKKQQEQLRSEDVSFREKELQSNISFQNQQIAAQNRQLQQQQQIAEQQAKQAQQSNMLSTASLGIAAYPKLKEGYTALKPLVSGLFNSGAETAPIIATEPIFGGVSTGTGTSASEYVLADTAMAGSEVASSTAGSTAASSGTSATAGGGGVGSGLTTAGWVAAAIAGQHMLANATDTVFEGQKTGDFFSRDDQGRWAPRFGNDPWHGYLNSQWGFGPSAGEKWDAAWHNGDTGEVLRRTPALANQWLDPVGDFASDAAQGVLKNWGVDENIADALVAPLNPIGFIGDKIAETKDIGDFVNTVFNPFSWF